MRKYRQFQRIHIEIVNTCNLKCSFCPAPLRDPKVMTPSQFKEVAASIAPKTKEVVLHLLGEPLSHPQFDEIIQAAAEVHLPVNLVTNGLLLMGQRVESVLHPIVRQISFSLQAFSDNFPEQSPKNFLQRLKSFSDRALVERPDLYLNFRFWDLSSPDALQTNHNQNMRQLLAEIFSFDWNDIQVHIKSRKNHRLQGRHYLHFDTRFEWPDLKRKSDQVLGKCYALTGHFGIHVDGTVVPCCLDHNGDIPLGNVFQQSIEEILQSPRAVAIKEGFAAGKIVEDLCKTCTYINRF